MTVHDVLKYGLHGYTRVTDNLCREIRFGRISREDAIVIEKYYQSEYPAQAISVFLEWLGMGFEAFQWYLKRMSFRKMETMEIKLNKKQMIFISGFLKNSTDVIGCKEFTIYGKGMNIK